jgi:SAM-dependent methyltransferase
VETKEDLIGSRCGICGGGQASGNHEAREMMFGLSTTFHYALCAGCGSLWLTDPPGDFSVYYPREYYSFANGNNGAKKRVTDLLRTRRDWSYFGHGGVLGRFLARRYEEGALLSVSKLKLKREARILDVGCGSGKLLHRMKAVGFKNLVGVDPFLSNEISAGNGMRIYKCRLEDMRDERYDVVMFHHSLEHVADPKGTLQTASRLLARGGICLVRLPIVAHAWERYGTNWVQLDPPRHMWVPTERAMRMLAESAGLVVESTEYDSTGFQFWGSELNAQGLTISRANGWRLVGLFGVGRLKEFRDRSRTLNRQERGDQAVFLLRAKQ